MSEKILFVDDDPNLLAACRRSFHKQFEVDIADGGEAGLRLIAERGPYAVVVSDRQMPRMDGIQFLSAVRQTAPDSVRILLTGNVDLEAAVRVVNEGSIFRFLIKPCPHEILSKALEDARTQYRLVIAEKELLNKTLSGSIRLLTEILATVDMNAFGRDGTLRSALGEVVQKILPDDAWEVQLAAMLAPIGYVSLPPELIVKAREGQALSKAEERLIARVPEIASRLLGNIPRLEGVARIVRYQHKRFDGTGFPPDAIRGEAIPPGARLLKILFDLQAEGKPPVEALDELRRREGWYDPTLLAAVRSAVGGTEFESDGDQAVASVAVKDLKAGMILRSDVLAKDGTRVLPSGHLLNRLSLERIQNFNQISGIREPIHVDGVSP